MIPMYWNIGLLISNLLLFLQLRLYGDGDVPLDRDPG